MADPEITHLRDGDIVQMPRRDVPFMQHALQVEWPCRDVLGRQPGGVSPGLDPRPRTACPAAPMAHQPPARHVTGMLSRHLGQQHVGTDRGQSPGSAVTHWSPVPQPAPRQRWGWHRPARPEEPPEHHGDRERPFEPGRMRRPSPELPSPECLSIARNRSCAPFATYR